MPIYAAITESAEMPKQLNQERIMNDLNSPIPPRSAISLRPYQHEALAAIVKAEANGIRRQLIALPTGTGKTVIFSHVVSNRTGRALVLAHREELIGQAAEKMPLRLCCLSGVYCMDYANTAS
jgi:superfamily II DNA or RNA helicase